MWVGFRVDIGRGLIGGYFYLCVCVRWGLRVDFYGWWFGFCSYLGG